MIAAHDVGENRGAFEAQAQRLRDEEVIQPPPDVPLAGRSHRTPPGVMLRAFLELTERIHKTRRHKRIEARPFFRGETVVLHVGFGIRKVDLRMCDVQVPAPDDGFFLLQLLKEFQEVLVPLLTIREAREFAFGIRGVNVDEEEVIILSGDDAPLLVVFRNAEMRRDLQRTLLGEDGRAGVTFLLGAVPIRRVVRGPELFDLIGRTLGFLEAQDVRFLGVEKFEKVLLQDSAQAVDVPGNEFHAGEKFNRAATAACGPPGCGSAGAERIRRRPDHC